MKKVLVSILLCALGLLPLYAKAQHSFPSRPIKLVVPQPPGSGGDVLGRLISEWVGNQLGQPIMVENRPGANGIVAAQSVVKDRPDGHTLFLTGVSVISFNGALYANLPYRPFEDFSFIAGVAETPYVLVASKASGVADLPQLVEKGRAATRPLSYASSGVGNSAHLAAEMLASRLDIKLLHVPYKGAAQILNALIAGEVDLTVGIPSSAGPLIKEGRITGLAALTPERLTELPDVPTLKELGHDMPDMPGWYGVLGPAGMEPAVVTALSEVLQAFANDPGVQERIRGLAMAPFPLGSDALRTVAMRDAETWGSFIEENDIRLD